MTTDVFSTPFTEQDTKIIKALRTKELLRLGKRYGIFLGLLAYMAYRSSPILLSNHPKALSYQWGIIGFLAFFTISILTFLFIEYKSGLRLLSKDLKYGKKNAFRFAARKYEDFIMKKCLLSYPDKTDLYIDIDRESFAQLQEGEILLLETAKVSGDILLLKSATIQIKSANQFKYK